MKAKIIGAYIAGFLSAMYVAQVRGLNARPWSKP